MKSALVTRTDEKLQDLPAEESQRKVYVPRTDIYENGESIIVVADVPGASAETVDLTLEKNILTIHARIENQCQEGYKPIYSEYSLGDYRRMFSLSNEVDRDGIEASVKNGVLKLVLPKSKKAQPKKIAIKSE
jgi:Molecular chaperone (small heat shock protein)